MSDKKLPLIPFLLVSLLFLMWGVANNMNDTLIAAFKRILSMSDFQSSLVQFAFFGAYFCFSLPAALFIRRFSYKAGIILGLGMYALGTILFFPAGEAASYGFFLFAIYVMASGCSILETTANPYILAMGPKENATRRLNIAQTFNPIGAIAGILISRHFILSELGDADAAARADMSAQDLHAMQMHELNAVSGTYLLIGGVLIAMLIIMLCMKMPMLKDNSESVPIAATCRKLFKIKEYTHGVIAQFFYVGAQTCMWSFTIREVMAVSGERESEASMVFLYSIIAFTLFRMFFTWLMKYYKPVKLMLWAAIAAIIFVGIIILSPNLSSLHSPLFPLFSSLSSIIALVGTSAAMSLMFPTIYGIALENVDRDSAKIAASGLIMSIVGGALITPLQALLSDRAGISNSFIVPLICFIVILVYSLTVINGNKRKQTA